MGDVAVLGYLTYVEVWELERFEQRLLSDPYTEEDEAAALEVQDRFDQHQSKSVTNSMLKLNQ